MHKDPETYEDTMWCDLCDDYISQTVHDSGHERDSSGTWRICHKYGGRYWGFTGERGADTN